MLGEALPPPLRPPRCPSVLCIPCSHPLLLPLAPALCAPCFPASFPSIPCIHPMQFHAVCIPCMPRLRPFHPFSVLQIPQRSSAPTPCIPCNLPLHLCAPIPPPSILTLLLSPQGVPGHRCGEWCCVGCRPFSIPHHPKLGALGALGSTLSIPPTPGVPRGGRGRVQRAPRHRSQYPWGLGGGGGMLGSAGVLGLGFLGGVWGCLGVQALP